MSKKSTKIVAVAGVVAGLGVAALPAMTFAEVAGQVNLDVEVQEAIAMTIRSDADRTMSTGVSVKFPGSVSSLYGYTGGTGYNPQSLQVSNSKTQLLPNSFHHGAYTAADDSDPENPVAEALDFMSIVTVYTNADTFDLSVKAPTVESVAQTSLKKANSNAEIPAGTTIAAGTSAWGWTTTAQSGDSGTYNAISGTDATVTDDGAGKVQGGTATNVYYGVSTSAAQEQGHYTGSIIYTATTN